MINAARRCFSARHLSEFFSQHDRAVDSYYADGSVLVYCVGPRVVLLRECYRAGIEVCVLISELLTLQYVGMSVQEDITFRERGRGDGIMVMTVSCEELQTVDRNICVIGEDRELEYHLVHLGIAVSSHREYFVFIAVKQ